jgi:ketosteroid isomerase-like protein
MKMIFVVLLLFVSGAAVPTPANADSQAFVRDFYSAYKAKDVARMAQFYAPDATFVDPTFELDLKGPDQIRDLLRKLWRNTNRSTGKSPILHPPVTISSSKEP